MTSGSWRTVTRVAIVAAVIAPLLAACGGGGGGLGATVKRAAFTSKEFGVSASPRVSRSAHPPRGGGRQLVGKPYTVRGKVYTPLHDPSGYVAQGTASWYGSDFHGRLTANGEIFSANAISGAHPTLPLPSYVRVTNVDNGRSVLVRVNDRGPYLHGRVMDLSHRAADILGYVNKGVGNIQVQYVGPAPLHGDDTRMLLASVNRMTPLEQGATRFAMMDPTPATGGSMPVPQERVASAGGTRGGYSSDDLARDFFGLFGYAEASAADAPDNTAHSAVTALAEGGALVREEGSAIRLELGTFEDSQRSWEVATAFALLAAVDQEPAQFGNRTATRLIVTRLKPGVAPGDVVNLAQELGLGDLVLY